MANNYNSYAIQGVYPARTQRSRPSRSIELAIDQNPDRMIGAKAIAVLALSLSLAFGSVSSLSRLDGKAMSVGNIFPEKSGQNTHDNIAKHAFENLGKAFAATPVEASEINQTTESSSPMDNLMNAFAPKTDEAIIESTEPATQEVAPIEVQEQKPVEVRIVTVSQAEIDAAKAKEAAMSAYNQAELDAKAYIFEHESGNKLTAVNEYGCIGLGQDCSCYGKGAACVPDLVQNCPDWRTNRDCQEDFWEDYMSYRYGSWQKAKIHWTNRVPIKGIDKGHWW